MTRAEAEKKLAALLAREAPRVAVRGEWSGASTQMGVSEGPDGAYFTETGASIEPSDDQFDFAEGMRNVLDALDEAENVSAPAWNVYTLHWSKAFGRAELRTTFDPARVPRSVDDPVYAAAAEARRAFWAVYGEIVGHAESGNAANAHEQSRWFLGPHERVLIVRRDESLILASDGMSTPWPGVTERENGFGCEVCIALPWPRERAFDPVSAEGRAWIDVVFLCARQIIDSYGEAAREVAAHGAILLADTLPEAPLPALHLVMTHGGEAGLADAIPGLPFGPAALYAVTALHDADFAGIDLSAPGWAPTEARTALTRYEGLGLAHLSRI